MATPKQGIPVPALKRTGAPSLPSGAGLPPSRPNERARARRARLNPAGKGGPLSLATTEALTNAALANMSSKSPKSPTELAKELGIGTANAIPVRRVIAAAREALARRAGDYVDAHMAATLIAAAKGDARPAEWALEHIAEEGARIVDTITNAPTMPSLSIGIALGGIKAPAALPAIAIDELPAIDALDKP